MGLQVPIGRGGWRDGIAWSARPFPSVAAGNLTRMTEPSSPTPRPEDPSADDRFAGLADQPVDEHVEVFEAERDRLQTELGTIDRV